LLKNNNWYKIPFLTLIKHRKTPEMKGNQLLILVLLMLMFSACSKAPVTTSKLESTDSIVQMWVDVRNAGDIDGITALFAENAVVVTDTAYTGIYDLKAGFIFPAAPILRNLTCTKVSEAIGEDMAYQAGFFKHEWVKNDSVVGNASGFYSIVWKKQEDKS
jgi:ketosteroid isomerase-like protein